MFLIQIVINCYGINNKFNVNSKGTLYIDILYIVGIQTSIMLPFSRFVINYSAPELSECVMFIYVSIIRKVYNSIVFKYQAFYSN